MNPYEVLGVAPDAQPETIKSRYRALVRENHPDLARDESQRTLFGQRMSEINRAWAIVGDPQGRAAFDARRRLEELEKRPTPRPQPRPQTSPPTPSRSNPTRSNSARSNPTRPNAAPSNARENARRNGGQSAKTQPAKPSSAKNQSPKTQQRLGLERAVLLFREGRPEEAIALCHRILRLDYRNVSARELLAEIHLSRGEGIKAVLLWEQISLLRPQNPELRVRYQTLRARIEAQNPAPPNPTAPHPTAPTAPHSATASSPDWQKVPVVKPIPRPPTENKKGLWNFLRAKLKR